jgi:hypothetical protein
MRPWNPYAGQWDVTVRHTPAVGRKDAHSVEVDAQTPHQVGISPGTPIPPDSSRDAVPGRCSQMGTRDWYTQARDHFGNAVVLTPTDRASALPSIRHRRACGRSP